MSEPSAVQQAVQLLQERLAEARQYRDRLTQEIDSIEDALQRLNVYGVEAPDDPADLFGGHHPVVRALPRGTKSVRASVKEILDAEPMAYTPVQIRNLIPDPVFAGKSKEQRINSVRTALWSLRQKGDARLVDDTHTMSNKWPEAPRLPTDNGAGNFASTEAQT